MMQTPIPRCDCCGLPISTQAGEDCPRCNYPINITKEERFLESAIQDLRRVATHGGAHLTVAGLLGRYQMRLDHLRRLKMAVAPTRPPVAPAGRPSEVVLTNPPASPYEPLPHLPYVPQAKVAPAPPPGVPVGRSPQIVPPAPPIVPVGRPSGVAPASPPPLPVERQVVVEPVRESRSFRELIFSWTSFFVDQAITIIGLLGAFLILIGALSSVINNAGNPLVAFLVVFGVHAFFGVAGVIAYRFPNFRLIARMYIGIYALLVPLVGFTAYNLLQVHAIQLTVPTLIAIAAAYATIVYALLAIYQDSVPFGYLGAVALAVADLAVASAFGLGYWWWPGMLMLLALPALVTVSSNRGLIFTGRLAVLRDPLRILMFTIIGVCVVGIVATTLYALQLDILNLSNSEVRFAILSMTTLLLLWSSLYRWLTQSTKGLLVLAYLFLACVLAFCYALQFEYSGYALALTGVAVLYHGHNRFAARLLQPFGKLGLRLDQLALILVSIVPVISEPLLPFQLLVRAYLPSSGIPSWLGFQMNWGTLAGLIAVGLGLMLTVSVAFNRAGLRAGSDTRRNAWPWLLLLSGLLLNWEYSVVVLMLNVVPAWYFLGLMLALVAGAVVARERFGSYWANPLDILALGEAILTLGLSLGQSLDSTATLLLIFAALSYGVVLYQRRQNWLFLPLVFALLALPILVPTLVFALLALPILVPSPHLYVVLLIGVLLPLASVAIRRLMAGKLLTDHQQATVWEWPLIGIGLLYGVVVSANDIAFSGSAVQNWLHVPFPVALEMATLSLAWYMSAALARIKWWLIPVIGFAVGALLLTANDFWVLAGVTFGAALLALGISRFAGRDWALPLYIVTLLGAVMTGIAGHTQNQLPATTLLLLAFALLVYIIGMLEDWTPWLWIMPLFATWSLVDSAALLGDLYRPPTLVLICAAAGMAIGFFRLFASRRNKFLRYVLPFYATALVAAVLTGLYGTLGGVNNPFPGAVPVALLLYAAVAYVVLLFERQPNWLWLVAGFATWGIVLATQTTSYTVVRIEITAAYTVVAIGIAVGIVGLVLSRVLKQPAPNALISASGYNLVKFTWGWPWYATALVAAIVTGLWTSFPEVQPGADFIVYSLLVFAVLFYIIGVLDDQVSCLWIASALAAWSRIDSALAKDLYGLFTVALVCVAMGAGIGILKRFVPSFYNLGSGKSALRYALPFYVTALVSAVLTGIDGMILGINQPFYGAIPAVLLLYAAIAYGVLLFERRPWWLGLVAGFAIWGTLLATRTASFSVLGREITANYDVVALGIAVGIAGLVLSRTIKQPRLNALISASGYDLVKFTWSWPWYATALVAAIVTGIGASLPVAAWALLIFAVLFYSIGIVEDFAPCLWIAPAFATWSLIDSTLLQVFYRLPTVALACVAVGVAMRSLKQFIPPFRDSVLGNRLLKYALPFYTTALAAAVLTGIYGMVFGINQPFYRDIPVYGVVPDALLLYAAVVYAVLLFERQRGWLWLVAGFSIWGMLLAPHALAIYYVVGTGIVAGLVGLLMGRLIKQPEMNVAIPTYMQTLARFTWSWPWYVTTLVAAAVTSAWPSLPFDQPAAGLIVFSLLAFTTLAVLIMLVERTPEMLVFPVGLAAWAIWQWQPPLDLAPLMVAYSLLCALIFASQFVWKILPPATNWLPATRLHRVFGLGGQALVVLVIIQQGGLSADSGLLAHVGAGALFVLALLLLWYGRLQSAPTVQRLCYYGAGLLVSLVIPWELSAFRQTQLDLLTLGPASYLVVIAPFLLRDEALPQRHRLGQVVSMLGAALLLLPTLWLSFSDSTLTPTLILAGESLVLLLLGIGARVRFFVLGGAALVVVAALHALFLSTLGFVALMVLGITLLAVATGLALARHRIQAAWTQWE